MRLADDLGIADDGRVFFSEATTRYGMHECPVDRLEGRGNGRISCYDPKTNKTRTVLCGLKFPNCICVASDGQSILFAETWDCSIKRFRFDGPKKGRVETVVDNLPGYRENINLASDGNFWLDLVGMLPPALDPARQTPKFRKQMAKRASSDDWLFPNINSGGFVKFNEQGGVVESLWDRHVVNHPMITSMREHKVCLYQGGTQGNRIGALGLDGADPTFNQCGKRWGKGLCPALSASFPLILWKKQRVAVAENGTLKGARAPF